ncbi:MAG: hypothetical protein Q8M03_05220, partial [Legionella sp.]|nr:hypothetical protein [Legionella sp.]
PFKTEDAGKKPIVFGTDYAIYCVVSNDPTKFAFSAKFRASCPSTLFQVTGESTCRSCPDTQALCDGTTVIRNQAGYWRNSNLTTSFIKCRIAGACPEGSAALYGAAQCTFGYQGAMCDDCIDGYGKDSTGLCAQSPAQ